MFTRQSSEAAASARAGRKVAAGRGAPTRSRVPLLRAARLVPVLLALLGMSIVSAGPLATPTMARELPIALRHAAATAGGTMDAGAATPEPHGMGWQPSPGLTPGVSARASQLRAQLGAVPSMVDLSENVAPVGNQGQVGSCVSWASGYYYRYWLRNHDFGETDTFAPMYLYSQVANGVDDGSTYSETFAVLQSQGIAHWSDYPQGPFDFRTLPTQAERTAAAPYRIGGWTNLFSGPNAGNQAAVQAAMAAGKPVLLALPVYDNFQAAQGYDYYIDVPTYGMQNYGGHAVFAAMYDEYGVWIENSWGLDWGYQGWAELSWDFVNQYTVEGWTYDEWSVTLGASPTGTVAAGSSVTLTATANHDVSVSPWYITILAGDNSVVRSCDTGTTCTATVTSATATTKTYKAVVGTSTGGSPQAASATKSVTWGAVTPTAPAAPANASAVGLSSSSIKFSWTDNSTNETGFRAYRFDAGVGSWVLVATLGPNARSFTDSNLDPLTTYWYTACAFNAQGEVCAQGSVEGRTTGPIAKLVVSGYADPTVAGVAHSLTVRATDLYGTTIQAYRGTVHFTSNDPKAVLPADYTFASADAGAHVFAGVAFKTAGEVAVRARDTVATSITGLQLNITVTPNAATKLLVTGYPKTAGAGTPYPFTVTAADAYGNRVPGYRGTVRFTSTDAKAGLPASYAFTSGDAGAHMFQLGVTFKTAGLQAFRATDTVAASITGLVSGVRVTPGAAVRLVVSGFPSPDVKGAVHGLTVRAVDSYGNTATGYRGTVRFTSTDAKATLPANYAFTAADAGIHTFGSVVLRTAGAQAIRATDTLNAAITGLQSAIQVS